MKMVILLYIKLELIMKKIGIIGAMQEEIEALLEIMTDKVREKKGVLEFYCGKYEGVEIIVVKAGIGKVNAAMCTQCLIDNYKPDAVINVGVAGAINDDLNIGDIVLSTYLQEHDFDVTAFGYEKGVIPRLDSSKFYADEKLVDLAYSFNNDFKEINLHKGVIVSGDVFVSSRLLKDELESKFNAYCAEMEGAAIAHVCYLQNVPFLVIRSMSDKADGNSPKNFDEFVLSSAQNAVRLIKDILSKM